MNPHSAPAIGCSIASINPRVYPVQVAARAQRASVEPAQVARRENMLAS